MHCCSPLQTCLEGEGSSGAVLSASSPHQQIKNRLRTLPLVTSAPRRSVGDRFEVLCGGAVKTKLRSSGCGFAFFSKVGSV